MCNQFHRTEAGVCNQFHRMEDGVGAHEAGNYYIVKFKRTWAYWKHLIVYSFILNLSFTICSISANENSNLRTDALLNVARIAGLGTVNTTVDEDLSNCSTSSLKVCTVINSGKWHIEAKNSFYGKLTNYSHFIGNGDNVSCKELGDGDGLSCAYYVGLSISIGCLSSVALITMLARSEPQKMNFADFSYSWLISVLAFLLLLFVTVLMTDLSRNLVVREAVWDRFPSLLHFNLLALVGRIPVSSQRHFLVTKKSGTAVSTCEHVWDMIVRWAPYCSYFPAFFLFNWLLSSAIPLFPQGIRTAWDESCWLTQNNVSSSFAADFIMVVELFNKSLVAILICEQNLEDRRLKENFLIISKLFYSMLIVWGFGILANEGESLDMFRFLFNVIVFNEGAVSYAVALYLCGFLKKLHRIKWDGFTLEVYLEIYNE